MNVLFPVEINVIGLVHTDQNLDVLYCCYVIPGFKLFFLKETAHVVAHFLLLEAYYLFLVRIVQSFFLFSFYRATST